LRNNAPVDDLPGVQLRFNKAEMPQATTKGRVLDHIGFDVKDLKAFIKTLEALHRERGWCRSRVHH
jgi:hypothetical protein